MTITSAFHEKRHLEYIKQKIRKLFGISSKTFASYTNENVFVLDCYSSELVKFLTADGLAIGNKIKNKAALPGWISQKDDFIFGALRGLFDTDGGIYRKQKKYSRAFIEFQTTSPAINRDICFLLRKTKFTPSKTFTRSGFTKKKGHNVRIQKQEEVRRFFRLVGSSNPNNIVRFKHCTEKNYVPASNRLYKQIVAYKGRLPFKTRL